MGVAILIYSAGQGLREDNWKSYHCRLYYLPKTSILYLYVCEAASASAEKITEKKNTHTNFW